MSVVSAPPNPGPGALARLKGWLIRSPAPAKKVQFDRAWTPWLFVLPQMAVVLVFFYWPSAQAIQSSFYLENAFGLGSTFVGLDNYTDAVSDPQYASIALFTCLFTVVVTVATLALGMLLAVKADKVILGRSAYRTALIAVYAIAPPVAGLIGMMLFDQHIGPIVRFFDLFGWHIQVGVNYWDTAFAMTIVAVWLHVPYNFIFCLSGLQAIPQSVREAAAIDCKNGLRRFFTVTLPLLAPTAFFLMIINITYALFDTFPQFDVMLQDKPANNPYTLVYKVFLDGFRGNDVGGSSAQSVILMVVVLALTMAQFRYIERRVHYG